MGGQRLSRSWDIYCKSAGILKLVPLWESGMMSNESICAMPHNDVHLILKTPNELCTERPPRT